MSPLLVSLPNLSIVATKASVPFDLSNTNLYKKVTYIDNPDDIYLLKNNLKNKNFIVFTGWKNKAWNKFALEQKKAVNAKIVVVVDNILTFSLRQIIGALYFRLILTRIYDAAFVPGIKSTNLLRFLGMKKNNIYVGNYGAYEKYFFCNISFSKRKNQFLYVGQFVKRKSLDLLLEAFKSYKSRGGTWDLCIVGDGNIIVDTTIKGLIVLPFQQPDNVARIMNQSKVFCLLSKKEHWGTALCEAAACGMNLLSYYKVGSATDLVRNGINGRIIYKLSVLQIVDAMFHYQNLSDEILANGSKVSIGIASGFNSRCYEAAFLNMISEIT